MNPMLSNMDKILNMFYRHLQIWSYLQQTNPMIAFIFCAKRWFSNKIPIHLLCLIPLLDYFSKLDELRKNCWTRNLVWDKPKEKNNYFRKRWRSSCWWSHGFPRWPRPAGSLCSNWKGCVSGCRWQLRVFRSQLKPAERPRSIRGLSPPPGLRYEQGRIHPVRIPLVLSLYNIIVVRVKL